MTKDDLLEHLDSVKKMLEMGMVSPVHSLVKQLIKEVSFCYEDSSCVWQPIETAPKDRPILACCNHEAESFTEDADGKHLTLYAAHYEGLSHAQTGWHIVEWGGGFDDSTHEYSGAYLPDWWFVAGSEFEVAANPTKWMFLPDPPKERPSA